MHQFDRVLDDKLKCEWVVHVMVRMAAMEEVVVVVVVEVIRRPMMVRGDG